MEPKLEYTQEDLNAARKNAALEERAICDQMLDKARAAVVGNLQRMAELEAEAADLRQDAERWRWLRAEHDRTDPVCHLVWKRNGDRNSSEWVNTARLDVSADQAIEALRIKQPVCGPAA